MDPDASQTTGRDLTTRMVESFFNTKKGGKTPKGISVQGHCGCTHWTITRRALGLPRIGRYDIDEDRLPFALCCGPRESVSLEGPMVVEVHPAVAIWATGFLLAPRVSRCKRGGTRRVYRYDPRAVWKQIIKRVVAAGGKRITPYGMRHTFASNLLIGNVSDTKVARWLGHSDTRMVHRHYGHLLAFDDDINRL